MCGISAIVSSDLRPISRQDLQILTRSLAHRGPDDERIWVSQNGLAGLGHRRLSILDTTDASAQPMLSADGRWVIAFNGEIYNFLEVRALLEQRGHVFTSEGDTEVLLNAWIEWGVDMLPRLNGMFALVVYDNLTKEAFLARDRFGVKPLVYSLTPRGLYLASEAQALLKIDWLDRTVDERLLQRAVVDPFGHEASENSVFSALKKLPAGHYASYREGRFTLTRWWRTADNLIEPPATIDAAGEQFRELFRSAVQVRMRADVPLGNCLSGGFDSTAIVGMMADIDRHGSDGAGRQAEDWRHCFVAGFPGHGHDETANAQIAADFVGIKPKILDLSKDQGIDDVERTLQALDDIYISLPTAPYKIYKAVSDAGVKVTLDGHGADEAFGGYRTSNSQLIFQIRNLLSANVGRSVGRRDLADRIRRTVFQLRSTYFLRTSSYAALHIEPTPFDDDPLPDQWSTMDRRLYGMVHMDILPTLLRNYDRMSMASGVEIRMPFMDWRVMCFIMSLPSAMKADDRLTKLVARHGLKGLMPDSIRLSPKKIGFSSQMPDWMNGSLGRWVEDELSRPHPAFEKVFDVPALLAAVRKRNNAQQWDWSSSDRIWPYANANWYLKRHG